MKTLRLNKNELLNSPHQEDIKKLLSDRYLKELKYKPDVELDLSILPFETLIITLDEDDHVVSLSGIDKDRIRLFAARESKNLSDVKKHQNTLIQTFQTPNLYAELTWELYQKLLRVHQSIVKSSGQAPFQLYHYPAASAARILPRRKLKVSEDGVSYEKTVKGAGVIAKKILIGNAPEVKNQIGYLSYEEAMQAASHQNQLISADYNGSIKVFNFDPEMWTLQSKAETLYQSAMKLLGLIDA